MDLEHSTFGECLGITRRWFYKSDYKFESEHIREAKVQLNDHIAEILKAFASEAKPTHKIPVR